MKTYKTIKYSALGFTGFAVVQLGGFCAASYPSLTGGITLVFLFLLIGIAIAGFINTLGLAQQQEGLDGQVILVGMAPTLIFSVVLFLAISFGAYAALGGQ
jgi:hypothetical protein